MLRKAALAISSIALVAAPVAAQTIDRSAAPVAASEKFGGENAVPLGLAALAVFAGVVVLLVEDNDDDNVDLPTSP